MLDFTLSRRTALWPVVLALTVACGADTDAEDSAPAAESPAVETVSATAPLVTIAEFVATWDDVTGSLELEVSAPDQWMLPPRAGSAGLRTVVQAASYCEGRVTSGVSDTFSLDAGFVGATLTDCGISGFPYDVNGVFCADVGVTSRFAGITVSDVVAEVVSIDPPEFAGYEHPTGTGADPDALPDGPNKPSDATGGLWLHGDLGPGGRGVARWMFRNPGGAFLFRGRVMGRFPELEDGIDDDCDGQVDNALGAYADGEPCRADEDCVSGVCDAIDPGTGFGTCAITCEEGRWGSPCADCPGGVGVAQCGGNGTCNDGAGGDGVCTCDAGFAPSGTTASDSCTDCVVGYWGASCTACESCNGGSCVDGMSGDGSCVCPEGYHATSRCADSCSDGEQNGDETDVDCGGAVCDACGGGGPTWAQQARITAADSAGADMFGFSVSIDGAYAIVGAQHDDDAGSSSGSAYIFVRSGATWTQQARITAGDAAAGDQFGRSVAISGDYAIVGA